jgi:hypothetical protein
MRHLRSFDRPDLIDLIPGFRLVAAEESGHRAPLYPRVLRTALERRGLLHRAWSPTCPLCSTVYDPRADAEPATHDATGRPDPSPGATGATERATPGTATGSGERPSGTTATAPAGGGGRGGGRALATYRLAQRAIPRARHRYWICALYERGAGPLS